MVYLRNNKTQNKIFEVSEGEDTILMAEIVRYTLTTNAGITEAMVIHFRDYLNKQVTPEPAADGAELTEQNLLKKAAQSYICQLLRDKLAKSGRDDWAGRLPQFNVSHFEQPFDFRDYEFVIEGDEEKIFPLTALNPRACYQLMSAYPERAVAADGSLSCYLELALQELEMILNTRIILETEGKAPGYYYQESKDAPQQAYKGKTANKVEQRYFSVLGDIFKACQTNEAVTKALLAQVRVQSIFENFNKAGTLKVIGFIPGLWLIARDNPYVMMYFVEQGWFSNTCASWFASLEQLSEADRIAFFNTFERGFLTMHEHCIADKDTRKSWYEEHFPASMGFLLPGNEPNSPAEHLVGLVDFFVENRCEQSLLTLFFHPDTLSVAELNILCHEKVVAILPAADIKELIGKFAAFCVKEWEEHKKGHPRGCTPAKLGVLVSLTQMLCKRLPGYAEADEAVTGVQRHSTQAVRTDRMTLEELSLAASPYTVKFDEELAALKGECTLPVVVQRLNNISSLISMELGWQALISGELTKRMRDHLKSHGQRNVNRKVRHLLSFLFQNLGCDALALQEARNNEKLTALFTSNDYVNIFRALHPSSIYALQVWALDKLGLPTNSQDPIVVTDTHIEQFLSYLGQRMPSHNGVGAEMQPAAAVEAHTSAPANGRKLDVGRGKPAGGAAVVHVVHTPDLGPWGRGGTSL